MKVVNLAWKNPKERAVYFHCPKCMKSIRRVFTRNISDRIVKDKLWVIHIGYKCPGCNTPFAWAMEKEDYFKYVKGCK